jgi:hypothetical protein
MLFVVTLQLATVIEEVKRELNTTDKALAIDLGYDRASDYAKAKHGVRPMAVDRWLAAPARVFDAFQRVSKRLRAADDLPAPAHYPDADLLEDIAVRLDQLRTRMVRAELRVVSDDSRKRA